MKVSPLLLVPPLLFAGLAALFAFGMKREDPNALPSARVGQAAPALALEPLAGATLLDDAVLTADGAKLVNFWASWCGPCRVEHPHLEALAEQGIVVHGVNYKDVPENAAGFLAEMGNPYAALGADVSGRAGLDWGIYGVPETFVLNGDGEIVLRFAGPITERALEGEILPALQAAERGD